MNSTIGGEDIECPCCKRKLLLSFDHTMDDKHLDEITETIEVRQR